MRLRLFWFLGISRENLECSDRGCILRERSDFNDVSRPHAQWLPSPRRQLSKYVSLLLDTWFKCRTCLLKVNKCSYLTLRKVDFRFFLSLEAPIMMLRHHEHSAVPIVKKTTFNFDVLRVKRLVADD